MSEEKLNQPLSSGVVSDAVKEVLDRRTALCSELENLPETDVESFRAGVDRLKADYAASPLPPQGYVELLDKRFALAVENAEKKIPLLEARREKLSELSGKLKELLEIGVLLVENDLKKFEQNCIKDLGSVPAQFAEQLAPIHARFEAEAAAVAADNAAGEKLLEELKTLTEAEDVAPLKERKPTLENEFKALTKVSGNLKNRFQESSHKASQKLARFFEALDYARWESYTLKLDICKQLEQLNSAENTDCVKAAKELQEIRDRWKTLGAVPKEKNEEVNARYLEQTRTLQHKVDEFFSRRRQERKQAVTDKEAMIAEAEKLSTSTEWNVTSAAFRELQARWKATPHTGASDTELYRKFRGFADIFFNARSAYFSQRDQKFQAAAQKKEALIAEAEALKPEDFRRARQIREDFWNAGSAGRVEPELKTRLNAALDKFFNRRNEEFAEKQRKSLELAEELKTLASDPSANLARSREIRSQLKDLENRESASAVHAALKNFDDALDSARKQEAREKGNLVREVARELAAAYAKLEAGTLSGFAAPAAVTMFPKLAAAAKLMEEAQNGDAKAKAKLEKHLTAARSEHDRICSELEKLAGGKDSGKADSLAAELEAAIMGNFAKEEAKAASRNIDPNRLAAEYLNAGLLPPEELENSFSRFDAVWSRI